MIQRENGRQLIIIGIIVIIVVLLLFFVLQSRGGGGAGTGSGTGSEQMTPVVVAAQTIPQGTTFRSGQPLNTFFTVENFPQSLVPFGAYKSIKQVANVATSAGCVHNVTATCAGSITTTQTIYQSVPVVSGMFSTLGQYRQTQTPSFVIPLGYVGIAISLSDVNSVLGSIEAGDNIDLIGSYTGSGRGVSASVPPQTQYLMNNLKVISVGGPPATTSSSTGSSAPAAGGGTLLVLAKLQQALVIQHLKDFGWQLSAVLPSAKEPSIPNFSTKPVTDRWMFVKQQNPFETNPGY
jgi:Flp pilus assembly protein CpaB